MLPRTFCHLRGAPVHTDINIVRALYELLEHELCIAVHLVVFIDDDQRLGHFPQVLQKRGLQGGMLLSAVNGNIVQPTEDLHCSRQAICLAPRFTYRC